MIFSRNTAESFNVTHAKKQLTDSIDLGLRTVEVKKIVGSVNRWQDFDSHFRIRNKSTRSRYDRIKRAMEKGEILPPVNLYKIKDKYYVVDGNHRVSAAKEVGQIFIDAHVIEFLPPADSKEHLLWREKSSFERRTHLENIEFSELGLYDKLLTQIEEFQKEESANLGYEISFVRASQLWYHDVYLPVIKQIQQEKLLDQFVGRTEADLFLYATYHRIAKSRLMNENVSYREALADFRPTPHKTLREKIIELISNLFNTPDEVEKCSHGLIIDEDGLVRVTLECKGRGCSKCKNRTNAAETILVDEDHTRLDLL